MIVYLFIICASLTCIFFGLRRKDKSKLQCGILLAVGLLLPCVLAACRAIEIGTDTGGYISHLFGLAQKTDDFGNFFADAKSWYNISDPLYVILNYLVARVFDNFHVFLFIAELLVIIPIFVALYKSRKSNKEVLLGMALFYLFEFNVTFNMLRQGIAISFVILMIYYLVNGKNFKSLICLLLAAGFHNTAIICLPLLAIYWIFKKVNSFNRKIIGACICALLIAFVASFEGIVMLLYNTGLYEHGRVFLDKYSTPFDFSFIDTATYLVAIIVYWLGTRHHKNKNDYSKDFYIVLGVGSLILLSLGWKVMFLERLSFYLFYPFLLYVVPKIMQHDNEERGKRRRRVNWLAFGLVAYFVIYWIVVFGVLNIHNTVPYKFAFLGMV